MLSKIEKKQQPRKKPKSGKLSPAEKADRRVDWRALVKNIEDEEQDLADELDYEDSFR